MTSPTTRTKELKVLLLRLTEVLGLGCYAHYEQSEDGTIALLSWGSVSLGASRERVKELILQLSEVEERERQRIADIFHGDLQQVLAGEKTPVQLR